MTSQNIGYFLGGLVVISIVVLEFAAASIMSKMKIVEGGPVYPNNANVMGQLVILMLVTAALFFGVFPI